MVNFIFLGPPGSGKGTLAKLLVKNKNMFHLSTGEIFRQEIANKTQLGQEVEKVLLEGNYVSDELTNEIIRNTLQKNGKKARGFVLDGYPRTINQVNFLEAEKLKINQVVYFKVSKKTAYKRLLKRNRKDDNTTTIQTRFDVYEKQTQPLWEHYQKLGKITEIDVSGTIEENYNMFLEKVFTKYANQE